MQCAIGLSGDHVGVVDLVEQKAVRLKRVLLQTQPEFDLTSLPAVRRFVMCEGCGISVLSSLFVDVMQINWQIMFHGDKGENIEVRFPRLCATVGTCTCWVQ